jgi:NitT/TauT family transport system substrate-binding protein
MTNIGYDRLVRYLVLTASASFFLIPGPGCDRNNAGQTPKTQSISTRIKWLPGVTYVGSYMARDRGYWRDLGLDVTIYPGGFEADPIKLVAAGSNEFGITGAEQLLQARSQGVPIVAIYMELARSPAGWMTMKSSGMKQPEDFKGKRVGALYGTNIEPTLDALLAKLDIDPKALIRVPVKYDLVPFYSGEVDVMPVYLTGQPILARLEGHDVSTINPCDFGICLGGNVYFTSERLIRDRPELVQDFVTGLLKGWEAALADSSAAVDLMVKIEPKLDRKQETDFFAATKEFVRDSPNDPLGTLPQDLWKRTRDIMVKYGGLAPETKVEDAFTNRFVEEAHKRIKK